MSMRVPDRPGVRIVPPLVYLTGLVAGLLVSVWLPTVIAPRPVAFAVGGVLVLVGAAVALSAIAQFRIYRTTIRPDRASSAFVTGGPFRITRNPMYVGLAIFYAGVAVAAQSLWALAFLPLVLWVIRSRVIAHEEAFLARRFGQDYERYMARVRRWL